MEINHLSIIHIKSDVCKLSSIGHDIIYAMVGV